MGVVLLPTKPPIYFPKVSAYLSKRGPFGRAGLNHPASRDAPSYNSPRKSLKLSVYCTSSMVVNQSNEAVIWKNLGTSKHELCLQFTLPTGQSFRWRETDSGEYTGVIGERLVVLRQHLDDVRYAVIARGPYASPENDLHVLRDYFNLDTSLADLLPHWCKSDPHFAHISPCFPGARMLRQPPFECLFSFICSSNNHISRIHGMVSKLASMYGTPLIPRSDLCLDQDLILAQGDATISSLPLKEEPSDVQSPATPTNVQRRKRKASAASESRTTQSDAMGSSIKTSTSGTFYSFPTLSQLQRATEEELREAGFGYRAKFITGAVQELLTKEPDGEAWLLNLRNRSYAEVAQELCALPGVGAKVAACVSLFSLDKHEVVPVDTHVWDLAVKHYTPHLAGKSLTKGVHEQIGAAFVKRFGPYAGWAHNTLFISELAMHSHLLPKTPSTKSSKAKQRDSLKQESATVATPAQKTPAHEKAGQQHGSSDLGTVENSPQEKNSRRRKKVIVTSSAVPSTVQQCNGSESDTPKTGTLVRNRRQSKRVTVLAVETAVQKHDSNETAKPEASPQEMYQPQSKKVTVAARMVAVANLAPMSEVGVMQLTDCPDYAKSEAGKPLFARLVDRNVDFLSEGTVDKSQVSHDSDYQDATCVKSDLAATIGDRAKATNLLCTAKGGVETALAECTPLRWPLRDIQATILDCSESPQAPPLKQGRRTARAARLYKKTSE